MRSMKKILAFLLCVLMLSGVWGAAENAGAGDAAAQFYPSPSLSDEDIPLDFATDPETLTDEEVALLMAEGELASDPRANADCDHPEDQRREHHSENKVRDDISGRYVFTYDDAQHTYRYHIIEWTQCAACGALLDSSSEYKDIPEAHAFENGECTVCGYVEEKHTIHDWPEPDEPTYTYYVFLDADTHQINVEYQVRCRVCGVTRSTDGLPVNEPHVFTDGVCVCGYREDGGYGEPSEVCEHMNTYANPELLEGDEAEYIDETYHSRKLDSVVLNVYCSDCGEYLGGGYDNTAGRTIKEEHAFTTKTATGAKCDCGYEIKCTHANVEKEEWNNYRYTDTYVDTGDGVNHTYIVSYTPEYICLDCGVEWSEDPVAETVYEEHDPAWDDETVCERCDGKITPSEEPDEPEEPIEPKCNHSHGFVKGQRETAEPAYSLNDEQHATRYYVMVYWQCPDCGESWDESEATGYVVKSNHTFENGFCTECGYKNACQHDETWAESYIESIEVLSSDASGHTVIEHVFQRTVCKQCGQVLSEGSVENEVSGAHSYGESGTSARCEVCNWSRGCEHPQDKRVTVSYDGEIIGIVSCDANGHTLLKYTDTVISCGVCGDTLDIQYSSKEVDAEHVFHGGACTACGYACPHEHLNAETPVENVEYCPCSYDKHTVVRKTGTTQTCADCGVTISYDVEETVATEPHRTEDGTPYTPCMDCGVNSSHHSCENFMRTWTDYDYDHYEHEDGECYRVGRYATTNVFCHACEKMDSYTLYDPDYRQQVPHEFDHRGICQNCSYYNDGGMCDHANAYIDYYVDKLVGSGTAVATPVNIVDNGDGTHSYTKYQMPHYYCPDCGYAYLGEVEAVEGYIEKHECNLDGVCWDCGARVQCTHPNAVTETVVWYDMYEHADKDGHWYSQGACMEVFSCPDCGLEDFYDADTGLLEPHDWYNGACTICGYENECAHENAEPYTETLLRGVKSHDADGHVAVYEEVSGERCPDCLEVTEQPAERTEVTEVTEAHKFNAYGECEVCGYVREDSGEEPACTHENTTETRKELPAVYKAVDDATHTKRVDATVTVTCDDCGAVLSEKDEQGTPASEVHTYEDGVCAACGHACAHAETTYGEPQATTEYAATDAAHTATTTTVTLWTCDFCGATGEETAVETAEAEAHTYAPDGEDAYKCSVCGHVCAHEGATETEAAGETLYADLTDGTHTLVKTTVVTTDCPHCPLVREETKEEKGEPEAHSYEATEAGSVCAVCGYACAHGETEITEKIALDHYDEARSTDAAHVVVGEKTTTETCASCGAVVAENAQPYSEEMPHTYVDGVCAECGHACSHAGYELPEETFVPTAYASNGADGHTVTGDVHIIVHCDMCGTQLSNTVSEEGVTRVEAHAFSGNRCRLCGYERPVEEAPETDVVTDEPIFTPVAAEETVHGVSAAQGERMATALATVVADIHAQFGEEVEVTVLHSDKILTGAEMQTLRTLDPVEQILVILHTVGYGNEVNYALTAMETGLSDEASALIEAIAARLAAMSEEERGAFQALIEEYFPLTKLTEEALEYDYVEFTLEIRVRLEDGYRMERYGFRQSEGVWTLTSIAVAGVDI